MVQLTEAEYTQARDNVSRKDDLTRRKEKLVTDTQVWMSEAVALHTSSHPDDKASVIALRADLITKLTAAVQLP